MSQAALKDTRITTSMNIGGRGEGEAGDSLLQLDREEVLISSIQINEWRLMPLETASSWKQVIFVVVCNNTIHRQNDRLKVLISFMFHFQLSKITSTFALLNDDSPVMYAADQNIIMSSFMCKVKIMKYIMEVAYMYDTILTDTERQQNRRFV